MSALLDIYNLRILVKHTGKTFYDKIKCGVTK